jgi:hypothetical protein
MEGAWLWTQETFRVIRAFMWSGLRCAFPRDLVEKVVIQPDGPHSVQSVERSSSDAEQKPNFSISVADEVLSRIRIFSIPDLGSASMNLSILTQKNGFLLLGKYDSGCSPRIRILIFTHPGSRGQKGTRSWIRIRNTVFYNKKK